ncbi:hypothetical protein [Aquimarina macrocephali]|uniref:hypothetical protein n=1 Tax=Aquimarina macrocephali TaxID=666563 RepID=UPI003F66D27D
MKNLFKTIVNSLFTLTIVSFTALLVTSCETESFVADNYKIKTGVDVKMLTMSQEGGALTTPFITKLIAGQNHEAGTVTVDSDGTNLLVTYNIDYNWTMKASHLYIGNCEELPLSRSGNPKIGKFPYKKEHEDGISEYTYTIPLSSLEGDCFCFAAHAEVDCSNIETTIEGGGSLEIIEGIETPIEMGECGEETAWGEGTDFSGNSWAMYLEFCIENPIGG